MCMKSASFLLHPSSQDIKDLCGKTPMIHYLLHHVQSQMRHASLRTNISAARNAVFRHSSVLPLLLKLL